MSGSAAAPSVLRRGVALLWESALTHPRPFVLAVFGASLYALMAVGGSIALGRVTDEVVTPGLEGSGVSGTTIAAGAALIMVAALLRSVGIVLRRYYGGATGYRMYRTWFLRIVRTYLSVPLQYFGRRQTGTLLAHADADVERAINPLMPLPFSLAAILIVVFATATLAVVDPVLMLVGVALFPALAVMNRLYTRRIELPAAQIQARTGDVSAVAHESFDGALVVKTLGLEGREQRRLEVEAQRLRTASVTVGRYRGTFEPALDTLPNLGIVVLLAIGSWRVSNGALSIGGLVQAMALFEVLVFPTRVVGFLLEELPRGVVAADRLRNVIATQARVLPANGEGTLLPTGALAVALDDVRFSYHDDESTDDQSTNDQSTNDESTDAAVLDSCTLRVTPGEVVALVGATGSGKSTLCHLVAHLLDPDDGTVAVGGVDLRSADPASVRRGIALAFQESFLFVASLRDNLTFGVQVDDADIAWALDVARADRFVARLPGQLEHVVGERGVTLSGGQRQRLALARALLRKPGLLLLDDATSAVDPVIEQQILANLRQQLMTTTLVVAHRLSTIALADRVLFLNGSRIAANGPHEELAATVPAYAALAQAYEQEAAA